MKKELLNKVERKYFEVKEDGRVEFFSKNAKEFLMAFTKEFLYEYCKDVVFGNPIILFTDIKKNNNYLKYLQVKLLYLSIPYQYYFRAKIIQKREKHAKYL